MKKALMILLIMMSTLATSAQDFIVKKDGNAIACRVVEVGQTEVVYKKWTELQSNRNYVMNISDITSIRYEDGRSQTFDGTAAPVQSPVVTNYGSKDLDDAALLRLANAKDRDPLLKKSKKLKRIGWICGGSLFVGGTICLVVGLTVGEETDYYWGNGYVDWETVTNGALVGAGAGMMAAGAALGTTCLIKSAKLKRQAAMPTVYSAPVLQNEFALKNGTTLAPSLNAFSDNVFRTPAVGLGLSYNF